MRIHRKKIKYSFKEDKLIHFILPGGLFEDIYLTTRRI
jgi:hypothetical protein